ncbi:MAG: WHG domain-containing protein [Desulfosarcina sp.]|nr:WHG domain-containing protein [Desulfosarcina sp.]MBC2765740.1 WHG domain-containing protein [Desulfosarcina sp.]
MTTENERYELIYGYLHYGTQRKKGTGKGGAQETDEPDEKLRETGRTYLRFSAEHKDYFDIINYFLATPSVILSSGLKRQLDQQGSNILDLIAGFIRSGISGGIFRSVDPKKYAVMFWGALHGLTQFKKLEDTVLEGEDHQLIFNYAVDQLIDGLKRTTD